MSAPQRIHRSIKLSSLSPRLLSVSGVPGTLSPIQLRPYPGRSMASTGGCHWRLARQCCTGRQAARGTLPGQVLTRLRGTAGPTPGLPRLRVGGWPTAWGGHVFSDFRHALRSC